MFFCFVQVLMDHIYDKPPDMKALVNMLMGQAWQELHMFGDGAVCNDINQVRPSHALSFPLSNRAAASHSKDHSSSGL
jgi:hypothetical protein